LAAAETVTRPPPEGPVRAFVPTQYHPEDEFDPRVDVEEEHQVDVDEYAQSGRDWHERYLVADTAK